MRLIFLLLSGLHAAQAILPRADQPAPYHRPNARLVVCLSIPFPHERPIDVPNRKMNILSSYMMATRLRLILNRLG